MALRHSWSTPFSLISGHSQIIFIFVGPVTNCGLVLLTWLLFSLYWICFLWYNCWCHDGLFHFISRYMHSGDLESSHCEMDKSGLIINGSSSFLPQSKQTLNRYVSLWMACRKTWSICYPLTLMSLFLGPCRDGIHVLGV